MLDGLCHSQRPPDGRHGDGTRLGQPNEARGGGAREAPCQQTNVVLLDALVALVSGFCGVGEEECDATANCRQENLPPGRPHYIFASFRMQNQKRRHRKGSAWRCECGDALGIAVHRVRPHSLRIEQTFEKTHAIPSRVHRCAGPRYLHHEPPLAVAWHLNPSVALVVCDEASGGGAAKGRLNSDGFGRGTCPVHWGRCRSVFRENLWGGTHM
mmetsp:Transcript_12555/g.31863  ORF Transcript_12555/g.31863 Transcript_12555/m.31863 type:complete len:213 (-) Transcript_12555:69-707(-)